MVSAILPPPNHHDRIALLPFHRPEPICAHSLYDGEIQSTGPVNFKVKTTVITVKTFYFITYQFENLHDELHVKD
jgi:hypothetical protein